MKPTIITVYLAIPDLRLLFYVLPILYCNQHLFACQNRMSFELIWKFVMMTPRISVVRILELEIIGR